VREAEILLLFEESVVVETKQQQVREAEILHQQVVSVVVASEESVVVEKIQHLQRESYPHPSYLHRHHHPTSTKIVQSVEVGVVVDEIVLMM